jgi:DNA repair exonuclease SbcCD nuclease subunit
MKILFTADWHIKLGQKNVPVDWQKTRFYEFYTHLNDLIEKHKIELLVLGGDTFDRVPSIEELSLFFEFLHQVNQSVAILIYPGNHEAIKKGTTFLTSLKLVTRKINCNATILDDYTRIENMDFIPYNKLKEFQPDDFSGEILFTHVRGEIPPHVKPEINLDLFNKWKLVLAGDLHSHSNTQRNIVYPGSPMTTSFHRKLVDTGVIVFDNCTLDWFVEPLEVRQLIRKTVNSPKDMIKTEYHHTVYELEGDIGELANVQATELLDKKVVQKDSQATLTFRKDMSISDELSLYLTEILNIEPTKVQKVVEAFNDSIKNT